jgi:hypothetical protein
MRTKLKQPRESTALNLLGENNPKGVLKPFQKYYLLINVTYVGKPT